jgi:hypothetical protein
MNAVTFNGELFFGSLYVDASITSVFNFESAAND